MTLGIVYAPILPIIALMALLWLLIISVLWKWDLVFVFTQQVSGGGRVRVHYRMMGWQTVDEFMPW